MFLGKYKLYITLFFNNEGVLLLKNYVIWTQVKRVKKIIWSADITNSDGSVFFNGVNFVEKCAFSFEDKYHITYIYGKDVWIFAWA